jgi:hypothetical protein
MSRTLSIGYNPTTGSYTVTHDREEETLAAKARWFQSLSLEEHIDSLSFMTDLLLDANPGIMDAKNAEPTGRRVQVLSAP